MKIKRFIAPDMRTALTQVKDELGPDAVIMSNKKVDGGVEIVAAYEEDSLAPKNSVSVDYNDEDVTISPQAREAVKLSPNGPDLPNYLGSKTSARAARNNAEMADTLHSLLNRQKQAQAKIDKKTQLQQNFGPRTLAEQEIFNSNNQSTMKKLASQNGSMPINMDPAIKNIQEEVANIRKLLQSQLAGLMADDQERKQPVRAMLTKLLIKGGFDADYANQLTGLVSIDDNLRLAWRNLENVLVQQLVIGNDDILRNGGAVTLVGPTGVGKTTTIAKLAAHFAMKYGAEQVALITTDNYRIGAYEQLQTYGRIMGCAVKSLSDINEMQNVLYQLRNRRLVLIDTAGMGQRDDRLALQLQQLINSCNVHIHNYLVLPATAQRRVLQETFEQFNQIELSGAIITKLDECIGLGDSLSVCMQNKLPLCYVTNGQRVPEDLEVANASQLIQLAINSMEDDLTLSEGMKRGFL